MGMEALLNSVWVQLGAVGLLIIFLWRSHGHIAKKYEKFTDSLMREHKEEVARLFDTLERRNEQHRTDRDDWVNTMKELNHMALNTIQANTQILTQIVHTIDNAICDCGGAKIKQKGDQNDTRK